MAKAIRGATRQPQRTGRPNRASSWRGPPSVRVGALAGVAVLAGMAVPARSETLSDALAQAYRTNPTLMAARANQRAADEAVPLAKADGRPSASAASTYQEQLARTAQPVPQTGLTVQSTPARALSGQVSLTVPLYSGGVVRNSIRAAQARVESGRSDLRGTEAAIFSQVAGAYMDVIRDSQIVVLNERNVAMLETNLRATRDKFDAGDVTRTDVAQSQSRLEAARADLENARAVLIGSKESYLALVGAPPAGLEMPPPLAGLPVSPDDAVDEALADNPDLDAARRAITAARYDVSAAKGQVMPRVSAFANGSYSDFLGSEDVRVTPTTTHSAAAGVTISLPLYQGGRPAAAERQAVARESAAREQAVQVERGVIAQVRAAYASWRAANTAIGSRRAAVASAELSLRGVTAERTVGARTVLDLLNAQQEALNAQVQLVGAQRDAYVAGFTLLAATGHASAADLGLDMSDVADPAANATRVRGKVSDFAFDRAAQPVAATTASQTAQDAIPVETPDAP